MVVLGIVLILIGSYFSIYLAKLELIKDFLSFLPTFIPTEFVINSIAFIIVYIIYNFIEKAKNRALFEEIDKINNLLNQFISDKTVDDIEISSPHLKTTMHLINNMEKDYQKQTQKIQSKLNNLELEIDEYKNILNLENILVCEVNEAGKVKKANKKFLEFFEFDSEMKFNMTFKKINFALGEEFENIYLNELLHQERKITINGKELLLKVEKSDLDSYIISLIDISDFEKEKREIEKKVLYANGNLKSVKAINKTFQIVMIRILNYENYAAYLGRGIMDVFEEKFVEKIKSLGYDEIFKVQNDIFAIYDLQIDYEKYKKILEDTIKVSVAGDTYIFNPKVILGGGVNYDQAYQQILESSKTLISKAKDSVKYHPEIIKLINNSITNNNVLLGYRIIEDKDDTVMITPVIRDEYGSLIDENITEHIIREFNLYLMTIKQLIINNINMLKHHQVIINVTSEELLSTTILADLLSLIKREDLFVIFNIEINSKYSIIYPILKQIKSYAQLGIKNVGKGYISFKDIYALKIDYLEIDSSIVELINKNSQWEFLLDSIKILVSAQNTKLLAYDYKDKKIFKISSELKTYQN